MRALRFAVKVAAADIDRTAETYKRRFGEDTVYHRLKNTVKSIDEIVRDMYEPHKEE